MAHYYIHIDNGMGFVADDTGQEFPDFEAARLYAIRSGAEIIGEELVGQAQRVALTLYIEDADHVPLATLPIHAAIDCRSPPDDGLEGDIGTVPLYP
ncbi:hypothetical protein LWE61_06290 [Sphingobium sufflavum]|uniref:DUF6894 family protein n=1 Tax=Sphingobium sufflavum TaxID=1129547 RepID=UPI001F24E3E6|nr:hypothetical protein [Sphingobium sufflavum]MCE7796171.1 hypothetical protein [Sphingobium sufflavum]